MARWRHSFYKLVPPWLSVEDGEKVLHVLGRQVDGMIEKARQAVYTRFPTYAGPTALALIGDERGIVKGRGEGRAGYARRLRGWRGVRGHQVRGNPYAMLYQIWNYFGGMKAQELDAAGNTFTIERDNSQHAEHGGTWNWDGGQPDIPGGGILPAPSHDAAAGTDVPDLLLGPLGTVGDLVLHCDGSPGSLIFLHVGTGASAASVTEPEAIKGRGWNLLPESNTTTGTGAPYTQRVYWRITGPYESFTSVRVTCTNNALASNARFIGRAVNVPGTYKSGAIVESRIMRGDGTTCYSPQLAQDTPFLRAAGTAIFADGAGTLLVPYPNGPEPLVAGDTFYMQVVARAGAADPPTPAGWTLVSGPDLTGDAVNGRAYLFKRTATATGIEGGTTVSLTAFSTAIVQARIYAFANMTGHEHVTVKAGQLTADAAALAPDGEYRLCAAMVAGVANGGTTTVSPIAGLDSSFQPVTGGEWTRAADDNANSGPNGGLVQSLYVAPEAGGGAVFGGITTVSQGWHVVHYLCLANAAPTHASFGLDSLGLLFAQGRLTTYSAATNWTEIDAERTAGATGIGIDEQRRIVPARGVGPGAFTLGATSAMNMIAVRVTPALVSPWYRFWLKLIPGADQGISAWGPWLTKPIGAKWSDRTGKTWGQRGVTAGDAKVVKNLFKGDHPWKLGGTKPEWLVLVLNQDEAHAPDGRWHSWTYNGEPRRYPGWRYWKL